MIRVLVLVLLVKMLAPQASLASERPCTLGSKCEVNSGAYLLGYPKDWDGETPLPALLFFHGWGATPEMAIEAEHAGRSAVARGYLFIAPEGLVPPGRKNRSWAHQGSPSAVRDETAFIREVMADVDERLPLQRERVLVSGFSQGGSMVWHLACFAGGDFRAFAPISGAFWRPHPESCSGEAVDLLHVHGFVDQVVPLEGRPIGERWHQGDVFEAMEQLRAVNRCGAMPDSFEIEQATGTPEAIRCRQWTSCASKRELQLCLHDGGHLVPDGWLDRSIDWFEGLLAAG